MTITLTSEEAQQVLDALYEGLTSKEYRALVETLRARLSAPEPEPEPVAWMNEAGDIVTSDESYTIGWRPLYTVPPQREWQTLTDHERELLARRVIKEIINVEAILQEKNS